jgi:hypothetical protein
MRLVLRWIFAILAILAALRFVFVSIASASLFRPTGGLVERTLAWLSPMSADRRHFQGEGADYRNKQIPAMLLVLILAVCWIATFWWTE